MSNLKQRVQIKLEIFWESIMDMFGNSTRRPLLFLAGIAVLLTLRSARKNVKSIRPGLSGGFSPYGSTAGRSSVSSLSGGYSPMGSSSSGGLQRAGSSFGQTSQYGQTSGMGGGGMGGSGMGGSGMGGGSMGGSSMYGQQAGGASGYGQTSRLGAPAGSATGGMNSFSSPSASSPMMSSGVSSASGSATSSGMATASLHDANGQNVAVIDSSAVAWKDYGGLTEFSGQIETLQAFDDYSAVQNVLNSPGMNKVLIVDGGSSTRTAIFDAASAQIAQRNGWRGIILTGSVRNSEILASMNMGVKALGTTPVKGSSTGGAAPAIGGASPMGGASPGGLQGAAAQLPTAGGSGSGQKGVAVNIGGMNVNPGLYVYADKDGLLLSQNQLAAAPTANYGSAGGMGMSSGGTSPFGNTGAVGSSMAGGGGTGMVGASTSQYGATAGGASQYGNTAGGGSQYGATAGGASQYGNTAGGSSLYGGTTGSGATARSSYGGGMSAGGQTAFGGTRPGGVTPMSGAGLSSMSTTGSSRTSPYGAPKRKKKLNKKSFMIFMIILLWCIYSWKE